MAVDLFLRVRRSAQSHRIGSDTPHDGRSRPVNMRYPHSAVNWLLLLALSSSDCVHKPYSKPESSRDGTIFMEQLQILSQPDQELGLSVFDAAVLFQEG